MVRVLMPRCHADIPRNKKDAKCDTRVPISFWVGAGGRGGANTQKSPCGKKVKELEGTFDPLGATTGRR